MKKLKIDINNIKEKEIDLIVDYFKHGKIVSYPSDTVYGLGGIATKGEVVDKIYDIKKRDRQKPMVILVSSIVMAKKYCYISEKQEKYLKKVWPGAVSVVLKSRELLPKELSGGHDSLTLRLPGSRLLGRDLPKNDFLTKIVSRVEAPIISTSLNISGRPDKCIITGRTEKYFKAGLIDLSVETGPAKRGEPSKIIDIRDINNIKILRN